MDALAVRYRPKVFADVVSQKSIINILEKQLELNQFKNSYIFYGASGCGKTTTARIFANRINGGTGHPIEIDAASNNGVDNVKQIIKSAAERSVDSEYKIYIIDEAHALTSQAWQAFLKCIEEPPKYTIFIFCTTEKNKIPETIKNRCMVFNFNLIPSVQINDRLNYISQKEGFINYKDTCDYISRISKGCMREAISLLEKVAGYDIDINLENALTVLGNYSYDSYFKLVNSIIDCDLRQIIECVEDIYSSGNDMRLFIDQFLTFCIDISKYILCQTIAVTNLPQTYEQKVKECINFQDAGKYYMYVTDKVLALKNMLKTDINPKDTIIVMLMSIARCQ